MEKVSSTAGAVCNGCLLYEQQGQKVIGAVGGTGEPIGASAGDSLAVTWASPPISRWRNYARWPAAWQQMVRAQEAVKPVRTRRLLCPFPSHFKGSRRR